MTARISHDRVGLETFPARQMQSPRFTGKYRVRCGRACIPRLPKTQFPLVNVTNGVHVPTWLAPQMSRLYDRHLGTGWHEHSSEARIWEGIEGVDDGELWETHLNLKSRLLEFVRQRAIAQAERRDETPESLQRLSRILILTRSPSGLPAALRPTREQI